MAQQRRGGRRRRKVDFIAANHIEYIDYKDTDLLRRFISERGKDLQRRVNVRNPSLLSVPGLWGFCLSLLKINLVIKTEATARVIVGASVFF